MNNSNSTDTNKTASPTQTYAIAWSTATTITPPSCPASSAGAAIGVSDSRFRKPLSISVAMSVPAFRAYIAASLSLAARPCAINSFTEV